MRDYITVVSGLPRSGTSLMMQMLYAGGMPVLTDNRRVADAHNPHGYFEDDRVRRLAEDSSWIGEARGKAVKIIYRLLQSLPASYDYRVIFMLRQMQEIFDSQQDMLISVGSEASAQDRAQMIRALSADLERVRTQTASQPNFRRLDVTYADVLRSPAASAERISEFLGGGLDVAAMVSAVDPKLYRHRN